MKTNPNFTIDNYLNKELFSSLIKYNQDLETDLNQSFSSIIDDWPMISNLIENFKKNYLNRFLNNLNTFIYNSITKFRRKLNTFSQETELIKEYMIEMFNIIFESFEDKFIRLRKFLFKSFNLVQSIIDKQIYLIKSYVPNNYWNLIDDLWSILLSTDYWQTKFPVINSNLISFYF